MLLQKSRYLQVHLGEKLFEESANKMDDEIRINIKYCLPRDVNQKHFRYLHFKAIFLAKNILT